MIKKELAALLAVFGVTTAAAFALPAASRQDDGQQPGAPPKGKQDPRKGAFPKGGGPDGPGGPGGGFFGPGMFLAPRVLELADADKDGKLSPDEAAKAAREFVQEADEKKAGSIDEATLGRAINKKAPPPDFGGPDGPPPGDFGPGTFMGPQIFAAADADNDKRLTPDEAARAAEKFVREAAKNAPGVDADGLAEAMNRRMGPPQGFGPGGPGGFGGAERKLVKEFDKDKDGFLDNAERKEARASIKKEREKGGRRGRGFGPPGGGPPGFGPGARDEPGKPGPRVDPSEVAKFPGKRLYDPTIVRTLFLEFENKDWESELADFNNTDVEVPATLSVDGKTYDGVGVHFRGMSSFMGVREGSKRSFNVSLDFRDPKQRLEGYKTLNLLNSHEDPTFLHTVLYLQICRAYIPAPKANFVKVVVNGESWGVYVNAQQFDKIMIAENFPDSKGSRWKVPGNPGARGGLEYIGDKIDDYKQRFQIKTKDDPKAWRALIALCKTLNETPPERLEEALRPMLDIEGTLKFLALDNALINNDGYWARSSDYSLYRDTKGVFHLIPHDANETFGVPMMMGFGPGGPMGGGRPGGPAGPQRKGAGMGGRPQGVTLDPLVGLNDAAKPLRSKLLAVPSLRARYLGYVRTIARDWLDWEKLGPIVAAHRALIEPELEADTRKLTSIAEFRDSAGDQPAKKEPEKAKGAGFRFGPPSIGLRAFADQRRKYLLNFPEIKKLPD